MLPKLVSRVLYCEALVPPRGRVLVAAEVDGLAVEAADGLTLVRLEWEEEKGAAFSLWKRNGLMS